MSVCILQNVPDLDPGCELRSRWIDSQNIAVYSIDKQGKVDLGPHDIRVTKMADGTLLPPSLPYAASAEYGVYEIQWKASHWNSATRKLVHQSYSERGRQ